MGPIVGISAVCLLPLSIQRARLRSASFSSSAGSSHTRAFLQFDAETASSSENIGLFTPPSADCQIQIPGMAPNVEKVEVILAS